MTVVRAGWLLSGAIPRRGRHDPLASLGDDNGFHTFVVHLCCCRYLWRPQGGSCPAKPVLFHIVVAVPTAPRRGRREFSELLHNDSGFHNVSAVPFSHLLLWPLSCSSCASCKNAVAVVRLCPKDSVMSKDTERDTIPVIERIYSDGLYDLLHTTRMQLLMADRVDLIEINAVKSYAGQASMYRGLRLIRLSVLHELSDDEMAFVICHELAHHEAGLKEQHSDAWREVCARLAREAGKLGLLPRYRVKEAVELALNGAATKFRGWPEDARKLQKERDEARARAREQLIDAGVRVGGQIGFEYRGRKVRGEVIRINPTTISVGEPGGDRTLMRVPFGRVQTIYVD